MNNHDKTGSFFEALLQTASTALGQKITPKNIVGSAPLSFAQQRQWFLNQLEPNNPTYNVIRAFHITGPVNVPILNKCFNEIMRRHDTLHTTFNVINEQSVQVIHPPPPISAKLYNLSQLPLPERNIQTEQTIIQESRHIFNLTTGPLWQVTLIQLSPEDHILLLVMHHIISDGWSIGIFFRELAWLYEAFSLGTPSPLPELPIQYTDFTLWQRDWLQGQVLDTQLSYWKQELSNHASSLNLPTDFPRPAVQTYRGAHEVITIPKELTEALKTLAHQDGATLFMALLAAFKLLLYRYSDQTDIIIGSPVANRNRVEIEGVIGFFVNTLALRTNLSHHFNFKDVLDRVRKTALNAYSHQDLPFEKLMEELQPERDLSRSSLFQVMFVFQNTPPPLLEFSNLQLTPIDVDNGTAKFDLTLNLTEKNERLEGVLTYNVDLYEPATIKRMIGHFQILLENIVTNPDTPIGKLPILTESERHQLLVEWNNTKTSYPEHRCLNQLFEAQVERTPNAIALVFENRQLTYSELNARANQLARHLQTLGIGPNVLVAMYMERSLEMIVGILAILKAGGAYVPLDPVYPKKRLAFILADTQAPVILTQQQLLNGLPEHKAEVICLDTDWKTIAQADDQNPISNTSSQDLAYVIYTSGSTGTPKGVLISHFNVVRLFKATHNWYNFNEDDVWTLFHSYAFDFSVWEIWGALIYGGQLVIVPYWISRSPEAFYRLLVKKQVTILNQTPSAFYQLIRAEEDSDEMSNLALRLVIFGGEALTLQNLNPWFERHGDRHPQLVNMYGITETTVHVTYRPLKMADIAQKKGSVIGQTIPDLQLYVLDNELQPVPVGIPGELHVSGAGLSNGYLNRPELTAEKFISNPFSNETKLYRSGDLVRYLPDGDLEYLGRIDHQVKIRGFRIELGEIESLLAQHPTIQDVVVIDREDNPGDKRLVAYSVFGQKSPPSPAELRRFLKEKLPDYMIPSAFEYLDTLPLTPNGKLDRKALPAPEVSRFDLKDQFYAPEDLLEFQLAQIWEQLLDIRPIGIKDNFFEAGGHSLLAVRLVNDIEKITGKKLSLATLFQAPTIEQLANILRQEGWTPSASSLVPLHPEGSKPPFFCIPGNLGNVFKDLGYLAKYMAPEQPFYGFQDGLQVPTKIEAMATHYLNDLQTVQPEGPYVLGGICSGGVIAFEMAQQLQAQGEKVQFLALVEPSSPHKTYSQSTSSIVRRIFRRFSHQSNQISELKAAEQGAYFRLKAKVLANILATSRYTPKKYQGKIDLFLTSDTLKRDDIPQLKWGNLAGRGADLHEIPGTHDAIVGDNDTEIDEFAMKVLTEKLNTCINTALADIKRA